MTKIPFYAVEFLSFKKGIRFTRIHYTIHPQYMASVVILQVI